jgi:glycosyltransferase involved in cell wall biosynthesis
MIRQIETMVLSTEDRDQGPARMSARERTRVLFVLGSAAGGGAERIVTHLVKHLNRQEFEARAGLLWRHGDYLDQFADDEVMIAKTAEGWIAYRDQPRWWQLVPALALVPLQQREIVRRFRPHIVVTVTKSMNIAARVALAFAGRRQLAWVVREGNNTGAMIDNESPTRAIAAIQDFAVRTAYRGADRVVAISDGVGAALSRRFGLDARSVTTIHNAVDVATVSRRSREQPVHAPNGPFIAGAGRLVDQKGFDLLIRAFARSVASQHVSLVIVGEGPQRATLEALARREGVADRVHLPGFVENPWSYFARAAAFVCSSRWEGFGNVIVEAMACGAPVVSTDCDFGPREIVRHNESGLLVRVDNVEALGTAIASVLTDRALAIRLADGGKRRACEFGVDRMTEAYERLFRELRRNA